MSWRSFIVICAALLTVLAAGGASAQSDYPNRAVKIIVDSAPGSATDVTLRIVAERLSRIWNQQVVALNHPGAGGSIAARVASQAPNDGYTLSFAAASTFTALAGAAPHPLRFLQARLRSDFKTKTGLTRFLPARLSGEFEDVQVEPIPWQGSGDMASTAQADCYLVVPSDREKLAAGEMVSVLVIS